MKKTLKTTVNHIVALKLKSLKSVFVKIEL